MIQLKVGVGVDQKDPSDPDGRGPVRLLAPSKGLPPPKGKLSQKLDEAMKKWIKEQDELKPLRDKGKPIVCKPSKPLKSQG